MRIKILERRKQIYKIVFVYDTYEKGHFKEI